jgi:predicted O-methyltransferase YrrM
MLFRVDNMFNWFETPDSARTEAELLSHEASVASGGMTRLNDYLALSAVLLWYRPKRIFEIGTYLGVTSDFFLRLLPDCEVVSIAYVGGLLNSLGKSYNNSNLSKKQIGSCVSPARRERFHQIYGDSHKLKADVFKDKFGIFDCIFIDGDHCADGVSRDTEFAKSLIADNGLICWHDANPKDKYRDVQLFLEQELSLKAVATMDDYSGGIACWSIDIEKRIESLFQNSPS